MEIGRGGERKRGQFPFAVKHGVAACRSDLRPPTPLSADTKRTGPSRRAHTQTATFPHTQAGRTAQRWLSRETARRHGRRHSTILALIAHQILPAPSSIPRFTPLIKRSRGGGGGSPAGQRGVGIGRSMPAAPAGGWAWPGGER
jgi:hypothetical protein